MAARLVGERPVGQSVRPAVAEMVGWSGSDGVDDL